MDRVSPINPVEHVGKLRGRYREHTAARRWPDEAAILQPLGVERHAQTVMPKNLGEEALDEVEPGAVLGREGKVEAAYRSGVEPGSGFPRDVRGMIVEDQLDR